jgi:two-component system response regulator YesN
VGNLDRICNYHNYFYIDECYKAIQNTAVELNSIIEKSNKKYSYITQKTILFIHLHYGKDISIRDIASEINVVPNYLSNVFKKDTGVTVIEYLSNVRINKAEDLLKNTDLKIIDIGKSVGFLNSHYFPEIFRRKTGLAPSEYRKNYRLTQLLP